MGVPIWSNGVFAYAIAAWMKCFNPMGPRSVSESYFEAARCVVSRLGNGQERVKAAKVQWTIEDWSGHKGDGRSVPDVSTNLKEISASQERLRKTSAAKERELIESSEWLERVR